MTPDNGYTPTPLATTAATVPVMEPTNVRIKFAKPHNKKNNRQLKPMTFTHSPIVMAMLTNNSLSNCQDVMAMMKECRRTQSDDQVCQTAAKYMEACCRHGTGV
jgi:hypothetical protein